MVDDESNTHVFGTKKWTKICAGYDDNDNDDGNDKEEFEDDDALETMRTLFNQRKRGGESGGLPMKHIAIGGKQ